MEMLQVLKEMDERGAISPRSPMKALLLSICPGLGQQYAGDIKRGIVLYTLLVVVSWLAAILYMVIDSRISIVFLSVPFVGIALIAADAYLLASRQPKDYKLRWFNRRWLYVLVFLTLIATVNPLMDLIVGKTIVRAYFVSSTSMTPSILRHDLLLVNKLIYKAMSPKRGDIVLLSFSKDKISSNFTKVMDDQLIRRVIAVPGDTLEIRGNEVLVNGKKIDEPYAFYDNGSILSLSTLKEENAFGPVKVPENSYFILGDNRNHSLDSRILGFIHRDRIGGKVAKIFWSWNLDDGKIKLNRTGMSVK